MFNRCCCADDAGLSHVSPRVQAEDALNQNEPYRGQSRPINGSYSERSLTAQEKEQEKARLQTLVNTFARQAVKGCPCKFFREGGGGLLATSYCIDKGLDRLMIMSPDNSDSREVTCTISSIQDIYSLIEDGSACFPPEVVNVLRPDEQQLLLMVVYQGNNGKMRFCIVEESCESRDNFLECLRILCIYSQSAVG
mmetsp:Transcript_24523/g.47654  ORF Transcript_24523/g.47654 Transcript_24523/m.47654 type:complete len:195 (-) Transcript_24523:47-631(-)